MKSCFASSASRAPVTSRATPTAASYRPSLERIAARASATSRSPPPPVSSCSEISKSPSASSRSRTQLPCSRSASAGASRSASLSGSPVTCAAVRPVIRSMAGFHSRTAPARSTTKIPSEVFSTIPDSRVRCAVTSSNNRAFCNATAAWLVSVESICCSRAEMSTRPRKPMRTAPSVTPDATSGARTAVARPSSASSDRSGSFAVAARMWTVESATRSIHAGSCRPSAPDARKTSWPAT